MLNARIQSFLHSLPKCEHHVHIEGCLSPELQYKLATRNNITFPASDPAFASPAALEARYARFSSLDDFLHYYYIGMSALVTAADFRDLALEYLRRAYYRDGVRHAEIFFDPQAHTERGVRLDTVVDALTAACREFEAETEAKPVAGIEAGGVAGGAAAAAAATSGSSLAMTATTTMTTTTTTRMTTALIPCFLRHKPATEAMEHLHQLAPDLTSGRLLAVGLDSSEVGFPHAWWRDVFAEAKRLGIRRTAHAGEEGGPDAIRAALAELDVARIDHGVAMGRDEGLMRQLAASGTLATVCPVSNIRLRVFSRLEEVPIRDMLRLGVSFSVNSDDPAYFGAWTLQCYEAVQQALALSASEWITVARNSIEGSWCGEERKRELRAVLRATVAAFVKGGMGEEGESGGEEVNIFFKGTEVPL